MYVHMHNHPVQFHFPTGFPRTLPLEPHGLFRRGGGGAGAGAERFRPCGSRTSAAQGRHCPGVTGLRGAQAMVMYTRD